MNISDKYPTFHGHLLQNEFRVESVEEAIKLANQFKEEGYADLFRGQTKCWPLMSSLARKKDNEREKEKAKLERFAEWIHSQGIIGDPNTNYHSFFAIAQHYGIATNYIDFTTDPEVAGFFASNGKWIRKETLSCIICINSKREEVLFEILRKSRSSWKVPEIVNIDVPNLWRLEAQKGVFLYSPLTDIQKWLKSFRIIFPYKKDAFKELGAIVYPNRKSSLEIKLSQYFTREKIQAFHENLEILGIEKFEYTNPYEEIQNDLKKNIRPDKSWGEKAIKKWDTYLSEKIDQTRITFDIVIDVSSNSFLKDRVNQQILLQLSQIENVKSKLLNWVILRLGDKRFKYDSINLNRVWDGLRLLPFDLETISTALTNTILLQYYRKKIGSEYISREEIKSVCDQTFGETLGVEMTVGDGSFSKGFVSLKSLRECFTDKISEFEVSGDLELDRERFEDLLLKIKFPNYLFEFEKFNSVFATEVVPSQVFYNRDGTIYFSANRLEIFGIP